PADFIVYEAVKELIKDGNSGKESTLAPTALVLSTSVDINRWKSVMLKYVGLHVYDLVVALLTSWWILECKSGDVYLVERGPVFGPHGVGTVGWRTERTKVHKGS